MRKDKTPDRKRDKAEFDKLNEKELEAERLRLQSSLDKIQSRKITIENDHYTKNATEAKIDLKISDAKKTTTSTTPTAAALTIATANTTSQAANATDESNIRSKGEKIEVPVKLPLLDQAALRKHDQEHRKAENTKNNAENDNGIADTKKDVSHELSQIIWHQTQMPRKILSLICQVDRSRFLC